MMEKMNIGVVYGGPSSEHEVSVSSGRAVLDALAGHSYLAAMPIFIDRQGIWFMDEKEVRPELAFARIDVVFNALHGKFGEDGQFQKICEQLSMRYTGSRSFASAIAMNKDMARQFFIQENLMVPRGYIFTKQDNLDHVAERLSQHFSGGAVIKPVGSGSSVGVSILRDPDFASFLVALKKAFAEDDKVLVEECIEGIEVTCLVIEQYKSQLLYAFSPVEIVPPESETFFSYEAKYGGKTKELVPPPSLNSRQIIQVQEAAVAAHKAIGCLGYSRTDMIVSPRGIYVLELNTLPGLTSESLMPKAAAHGGLEFPALIEHIISLALRK